MCAARLCVTLHVQAMSAIDDDATVTQLATAWVGVALGGAKVQEASYIYQELGDKFAWTVSTANNGSSPAWIF
jgi:coatomer protein complex subunit epsilon